MFRGYVLFACLGLMLSSSSHASLKKLQKGTTRIDGDVVQTLITKAIANNALVVKIPPGEYYFERSLIVENAQNLRITMSGVSLVFTLHKGNTSSANQPVATGIRIINSHNTTLEGSEHSPLVIDYDPLPYWQGTVVQVLPELPSLQPMYVLKPLNSVEDLSSWWKGMKEAELVSIFWKPDGEMSLATPAGVHTWTFDATITNTSCPSDNSETHTSQSSQQEEQCSIISQWDYGWQAADVGDQLTIQPLTGYTLNIANSSLVELTDIVIHSSPNKALTEFDGLGGHVYERVKVIRNPQGEGLLAANSDAFHSAGCKNGPTIRYCEFSNCGDDFFNVHNTMQIVAKDVVVDENDVELYIAEPLLHESSAKLYGKNTAYGTAVQFEHVRQGDNLTFYRPHDLLLVATASVVSATPSSIVMPSNASQEISAALTKLGLPVAESFGVVTWRLIVSLTQVIPELLQAGTLPMGYVVNMEGWGAKNTLITESHFHHGYCTAGRMKSTDGVIDGNVFNSSIIHNLQLAPLPQWLEGPMRASNMRFTNNIIMNSGANPITTVPLWAPKLVLQNNSILFP
eukprot:m.38969 g.38969  ORF g.38969 m.38969 type:complete len:571 (+) comp9499_c0_seq2:362-2074(+)